MHPFCKLSHEQGYRKVPERATSPYIDTPKTPETRGNGENSMSTKPELTAADGSPEEPLPESPVLTAHDDDRPRPPARIRLRKLEK